MMMVLVHSLPDTDIPKPPPAPLELCCSGGSRHFPASPTLLLGPRVSAYILIARVLYTFRFLASNLVDAVMNMPCCRTNGLVPGLQMLSFIKPVCNPSLH